MSAMASLRALLMMDDKSFREGAERAKTSTRSLQTTLAGAGAAMAGMFSAGAIVSFSKSILAAAAQIQDMSENLGLSTTSLQAFRYAAIATGNDVEQVEKVLGKLKNKQGEIGTDEKAQKAFQRLGITLTDVSKLNADELFVRVGAAMSSSKDQAGAFSAVCELFGEKVGPKMIALLREAGNEGLPGLEEAAKRAGAVMDKELIAKADQFEDAWKRAMLIAKAETADLADRLLPKTGEALARSAVLPLRVWDTLSAIIDKVTTKITGVAPLMDRVQKVRGPGGKAEEESGRIAATVEEIRAKSAKELEEARGRTGTNEEKLAALNAKQLSLAKDYAELLKTDVVGAEKKLAELRMNQVHAAEMQRKVDIDAAKERTRVLMDEVDRTVDGRKEEERRDKEIADQRKKSDEMKLDMAGKIQAMGAEKENELAEKYAGKAAQSVGVSMKYATSLEQIGASGRRMGIGMGSGEDLNRKYLAEQTSLQKEIADMIAAITGDNNG